MGELLILSGFNPRNLVLLLGRRAGKIVILVVNLSVIIRVAVPISHMVWLGPGRASLVAGPVSTLT